MHDLTNVFGEFISTGSYRVHGGIDENGQTLSKNVMIFELKMVGSVSSSWKIFTVVDLR